MQNFMIVSHAVPEIPKCWLSFHEPCRVHLKGRIVSERGDNSFKMRCDTLWHSVTPAFVSWGQISLSLPPSSLVSRIFPRDYRVNMSPLPPSRRHSLSAKRLLGRRYSSDGGGSGRRRPRGAGWAAAPSRRNPSAFMFKRSRAPAKHAWRYINTFAIVKDERVHFNR